MGTRAYMVRAAVALNDAKAARANLEILRRLAPADAELHVQLAEWCATGPNVDVGMEQVQQALGMAQPAARKARLYFLRGTLSARAGSREWAEADFRRAIGFDAASPLYVIALATLQGAESPKLIDAAVLRDGLARFPNAADLLSLSALRELDAGNATQAQVFATRLSTVAPGSVLASTVEGRIALQELNLEAARTAFAKAVASDARNAGAHHYLGLTLRKLGLDSKALPELQAAVRLDASSAAHHFEYGRALFENGRLAEARGELEATLRLSPKHVAAHYVLARVEQKAGNAEAAAKLLARYRELHPE